MLVSSLIRRNVLMRRSLTRGGGGHHYKGYNEPTGDLFGIPVRPHIFKCASVFKLARASWISPQEIAV
jgi:hypothetical protein